MRKRRRRFTGGLNSNRWHSARKTRRRKTKKRNWKKRCDETEQQNFFSLRLELLIKQQTNKQKSSNNK